MVFVSDFPSAESMNSTNRRSPWVTTETEDSRATGNLCCVFVLALFVKTFSGTSCFRVSSLGWLSTSMARCLHRTAQGIQHGVFLERSLDEASRKLSHPAVEVII